MEKYIKQIENLVFDCWGAELQHTQTPEFSPTHFSEHGYTLFNIKPGQFDELMGFFDPGLEIKYENTEAAPGFHKTSLSPGFTEKYNKTHKCFAPPHQDVIEGLQKYLEGIRADLERELSGAFKIVNTRAIAIVSGDEFGPTAWHFDGGPRFLRKMMIYPKPLNAENGSFETYTRKGKKVTLETTGPVGILGDVSLLKHRGVPGNKAGFVRPMLEITLAPADKTDLTVRFAGQAAREIRLPVEELPQHLRSVFDGLRNRVTNENFATNVPTLEEELARIGNRNDTLYKKIRHPAIRLRARILFLKLNYRYGFMRESDWKQVSNKCKNLNIGGGFLFNHDSWLNIDECNERNIGSLVDMAICRNLPISAGTIQKVYTSHFLEHLDDGAVSKTLREIERVLAKDGKLVIKIPDFDAVLKNYREGRAGFFKDKYFGPALTTWPLKGQKDNLATRASFFFAGYWNKAFGNPFSRNRQCGQGGYHGPAPLSQAEHEKILSLNDPHEISRALVAKIKEQPDFGGFNHQNSWSKKQLRELVENHGFRVVSQSKPLIALRFLSIPDIFTTFGMSQYLYAIRK